MLRYISLNFLNILDLLSILDTVFINYKEGVVHFLSVIKSHHSLLLYRFKKSYSTQYNIKHNKVKK